ncbi:MAG: hypothetical protein AABZ47_04115 [Planctomycetota bacterium]
MVPIRHRFRKSGVTLLEVLLSVSLLVSLSSMTYWFYSSALGTRTRDTQRAQKVQLMRVIMQRMANEIRQVSLITTGGRVGLRGEAERLWLSSIRVPTKATRWQEAYQDEILPGEYDLVKIEYKIARHPEILHEDGYPKAIGLARVELKAPRPDSAETGDAFSDRQVRTPPAESEEGQTGETGSQGQILDDLFFRDEKENEPQIGVGEEIQWDELYSKEIHYIRFCYYDGYRWWDDWDITGENPLPQLVQVTIGFEEHPPFDAEFGKRDEDAEEFCTCMNREPQDCLPMPSDQYTITVRLPQADPLFRSRVNREIKYVLDETGGAEEKDGSTESSSTSGSKANGSGTKSDSTKSGQGRK